MTRSKSIKLLASTAVIALAAVPIAACGGGGGATGATPPKTTNGTAATVGVADTSVGKILVDSRGRSLYLFKADTMTKSACTAACAAAWSPLLAHGKPTVAGGAAASLLGTATRADGTQQVTYHGHPLYLFADDQSPGDVEGQGVTAFGAALVRSIGRRQPDLRQAGKYERRRELRRQQWLLAPNPAASHVSGRRLRAEARRG